MSLFVLVGAAFLFFFRFPVRSSPGFGTGDPEIATVKVLRGNFLRTVRLAGTTQAVYSRPVIAPRLAGASFGAMVVTVVVPSGAHVKKGQILLEFDRQEQYKNFLTTRASYRDLASKLAVQKATETAGRAGDDAALKQAEDAVATAKLEVKTNELVTRIQAEINNETLQEDESTLEQLRHTYDLKRQTAAAAVRNLQIQEQRALETMRDSQKNMEKMVIRSPMDGVAVLTQTWLGGTMGYVQPGSSVYPGSPLMRVVDPSRMEVSVQVNQADFTDLRVGQSAVVHLEAYPDLSFPATLEELSPLGVPGQYSPKVMGFKGIFSIQGSSPKLMPDLSASVDVQLSSEKSALMIPIQSVAYTDGKPFVWIRNGGGFDKRAVRVGPANDLDVVVESGLVAGDVIREYAAEPGGGTAGAP